MQFLDLAYRCQCCKLCCSKRGLVDSQSGKTKRRFADIQQDVLHDGLAGSKTRPLQISGAPIAGQGMSLDDMHAYAECSTELVSIVTMSYTTAVHLQEELAVMPQCHCGTVGW